MSKRRPAARNATRKPSSGRSPESDPWVAAYLRTHPDADPAEVRAMREPRPLATVSVDPADELETLADELRRVDAHRLALVERRTALVTRLRAEGRTWAEVTALAGVSRAALIQRGRTGQL